MSKRSNGNDSGAKPLGQALRERLEALKVGKNPAVTKPQRETDTPLVSEAMSDVDYDITEVKKFIDLVFGDDVPRDENILCYFDDKGHKRPLSKKDFLRKLSNTHDPAKLYISTATVGIDPIEKVPLNRKALFKSLCVVVLDDIGTKIPWARIPDGFPESYALETSRDNYQLGCVLAQPITDYYIARAFISVIQASGCTDEGGNLVTKKVRCPQGVHGKEGSEDRMFRTRLASCSGKLWGCQELLTWLGCSITWEQIKKDAEAVRQQTRAVGSSPWSAIESEYETLDGIIDPVLEWTAKNDDAFESAGDWVRIRCPQAFKHSNPLEYSAYYSPVGMGEGEYKACRGFNCFHESCIDYTTQNFLDYVSVNDGPEVPVYDPSAALVSSHIFDAANNLIWDIKTGISPSAYKSFEAFGRVHNKKHKVATKEYKSTKPDPAKPPIIVTTTKHKLLPLATIWDNSPAKVSVYGTVFDPTTKAKIVKDDNRLRLNEFSMPEYGEGHYDKEIVQPFINYLEHLVPDDAQREMFTHWLAAKMQNMGFRGWGIMMTAKSQGTGRGTLEDMLTRLFSPHNCENVPFDKVIGGSETNNYNEWMGKPLIFVSEMQATTGKRFYSAYNSLKEVVDTTVKQVTINNKYGVKTTRNMYCSYIMMNNHEASAVLDVHDRRFYLIENPMLPPSAAFFTDIRRWMDKKDASGEHEYCRHVARWLRSITVNWPLMNGPAPMTKLKEEVAAAAASAIDVAFNAFITALPSAYVYTQLASRAMLASNIVIRLGLEPEIVEKLTRHKLTEVTAPLAQAVKTRIAGETSSIRPRVLLKKSCTEQAGRLRAGTHKPDDLVHVKSQLLLIKPDVIIKAMGEALTLEGYD